MSHNTGKIIRRIQIIGLFVFAFMIAAIVVTVNGKVNADSIVSIVSMNNTLSALILVALFGIKSLTIIVPLLPLYLASGFVFSPVEAVAVNLAGMAVALSLPYWLGRWAGGDGIAYLMNKYPKIDKVMQIQRENEIFAAFIIRLIGGLPCDVLSFYFGACRTTYFKYLFASLAGCSLSLVTVTLLGDVIMNPKSPQFIILLISRFSITVAAFAFTVIWNRRKRMNKDQTTG